MKTEPASRIFAGLIAAIAWLGIGLYAQAQLDSSGDLLVTVWTLLFYFTILTNLITAIVFTGITFGVTGFSAPRMLAGVALSMALVGIVYALLLSGIRHLTAGSQLANLFLHRIGPVLVPLYWLAFVPKGRTRATDPLLWAIYPVAYLVYALLRGTAQQSYPYPFIDVSELGWLTMLRNSAVIALGFLAAGWLMMAFDRLLARASKPH